MTYLIKITTSILLTTAVLGSHSPNKDESSHFNPSLTARIFRPLDDNHKIVGTFYVRQEDQRHEKGANISFRRRVSKGLFYGIEANADLGFRHDDNWKRNSAGKWSWDNSNSDLEFGSSLFLKIRKAFYFLPGTNWVGELNFKTHNNWTHTLLTLKPETSLTYLNFKAGKPFYNLFFKHQIYIPLNYSDKDIYKSWTYIGALYHYSKKIKPSIYLAYKSQTWTRSKDFKEFHPDKIYESKSNSSYIGVAVNYYY